MTDRVFLSYLREDADRVDQLARVLKSGGLPLWIDRFEIRAGEDWRISTRQAVAAAPFFVACLSARMQARERSIMWEELRAGVEEARTRPADRQWLIPVKLEPCDVPMKNTQNHYALLHERTWRAHGSWRTNVSWRRSKKKYRILKTGEPAILRYAPPVSKAS